MKYGISGTISELTYLYQTILAQRKLATEWKTSLRDDPVELGLITINGDEILDNILTFIEINKKQQGFRKNRSTTDAIFIKFHKPFFMCFFNLMKVFVGYKKY